MSNIPVRNANGQETTATSNNQKSLYPGKSTQERTHEKRYMKTVKVDVPRIGHLDSYTK